ncbi:MAG: tannase/feruloyl esterase family alpha/beta hydrolase [Caulobacteraceae bacterium]
MGKDARGLTRLLLASAAGLACAALASPSWAARCEDLVNLKLPDTVIKSAEPVAAGGFDAPDKVKRPDLPAFCRVIASVKAAPDSDVGVEIWLPADHWAGVFHGNGNGGFGGLLAAGYGGMEVGLRRGYATAVTDTGTAPATPLDGDALIGHPRKWKDWGRLSTHVMTVTGKAVAKAYYGQDARRSYYTGCSTGGQQGLIEALYYPEDYDGVLVGAPVVNRTWGHAVAVWDVQAADLLPGHKLSDAKLTLLNKAAVSTCGGHGNGLAGDPFIADPLACRFDPAVLACHGADAATCLTAAEIQTAKAFYSGPTSHAGRPLYYGWLPGSEAPGRFGWNFIQTPPNGEPAFDGLFKWVFGPEWDWRKFDLERDMPKVDAMLGPAVNDAMRGDISRFRARGGKLIIYQGLADTLVAPGQTLALYDRLGRESGGPAKARAFARLFMAPGVMHCGAGPGPDAFNAANGGAGKPASATPRDDLFAALAHWVEDGAAPAQVIATKYVDDTPTKGVALQRPLCAYPQKAWYRGSGDSHDASAFVCSVEKPKG